MRQAMFAIALGLCLASTPAAMAQTRPPSPPRHEIAIGPVTPTPIITRGGIDYTRMVTPVMSYNRMLYIPVDVSNLDFSYKLNVSASPPAPWEVLPSGVYSQHTTPMVGIPDAVP